MQGKGTCGADQKREKKKKKKSFSVKDGKNTMESGPLSRGIYETRGVGSPSRMPFVTPILYVAIQLSQDGIYSTGIVEFQTNQNFKIEQGTFVTTAVNQRDTSVRTMII